MNPIDETCTCSTDPCDPDCAPCSIEAYTPERPPVLPWQQELWQLSREQLEEVRAAYRTTRNRLLADAHAPKTEQLLLVFGVHAEDLPTYEELHPAPPEYPPVDSDRLMGVTVVNGVRIDDADRIVAWSRYRGWDESLPADERARIEAEFPDEMVAELVASGSL